MRGIRETDVAYLGAILVEPKERLSELPRAGGGHGQIYRGFG